MPENNKDQYPKVKKAQLEALFKKIDNSEPTEKLPNKSWQRTAPKASENQRPADQRPLAANYRDTPLPYGHFEELKAEGHRLPVAPMPAQANHFTQLKAAGVNLPAVPQPPKQGHGDVQTPDRPVLTSAPAPKYDLKAAASRFLENREMEQKLGANLKQSPLMARGYDNAKSLNRTKG
jgi:hypothetical protein